MLAGGRTTTKGSAAMSKNPPTPLVSVRNLDVTYGGLRDPLRAVRDVSFDVIEGETFAIIGESGSGKTTLLLAIAGLVTVSAGSVVIEPSNGSGGIRQNSNARPQVVFQDPDLALNPRIPIWKSVVEPLVPDRIRIPSKLRELSLELLRLVGLDTSIAERRPHELSGGQRQRVTIARALSSGVPLVLFDEPLSGQDVSLQAVLLQLLDRLRIERRLTYLIVSHNVASVARTADRVGVMYAGGLVEVGTAADVISRPRHPYTQALIAAVPRVEVTGARKRFVIQGEPPDLRNPATGCQFRTRCPYATEKCKVESPALRESSVEGDSRLVACHHWEEVAANPLWRQSSSPENRYTLDAVRVLGAASDRDENDND